MKKEILFAIACSVLLSFVCSVYADYSIDISGLKQSYSVGEEISYTVLLLDNSTPINKNIEVVFSDDFDKLQIKKDVVSNSKNVLLIDKSFSSLGWHVKASYEGKEVSHSFIILENSAVDFSIEGDKLIIKNNGNVRYTRDVKVKIGDVINVYTQNIPIGEEKVWTLIAPDGTYMVEITDGEKTFTKNNVRLNSQITGNAIGAMGEDASLTGALGAPLDVNNLNKSLIPTGRIFNVIIFIGAVLGISILLFIERRVRRGSPVIKSNKKK